MAASADELAPLASAMALPPASAPLPSPPSSPPPPPLSKPRRRGPARHCSYQLAVVFACATSGFLFGYDIGIIDTVLKMPSFQQFFGTATEDGFETDARPETDGNVVASFLVGCVGGAALSSVLADSIGRRLSIALGAVFFVAGGLWQAMTGLEGGALSDVLLTFYCARAVSGVSIGILSGITPLYLSEIAAASDRGRMVAVQQLMITIGILAASVVNSIVFAAVSSGDNAQWRGALGAQVLPGVFLVLVIIVLPFSPRWLMMKGRDDEAAAVLERLRGSGGRAAAELAEIRATLLRERAAGEATWREVLCAPGKTRRSVLLACGLQLFQQLTGINAVLYYAADLFARIGVERTMASTTLVIGNAALLVVGTLPGLYLIEVAGRRALLLWGALAMAVCHACVCGCIEAGAGAGAVTFIFLFTIVFSATWGPTVWVVQGEVIPLRARAKGTAVATLVNWSINAVVGKVTPLVVERLGAYTYLIFACCMLVAWLFVFALLPETMGKSLEAIELLFDSGAGKGAAGGGASSAKDVAAWGVASRGPTDSGVAVMSPLAAREERRDRLARTQAT